MQIVTGTDYSKSSLKNKPVHLRFQSNGSKKLRMIRNTYIIVLWFYMCFHDVLMPFYAHFKDGGAGLVTKCHADFCHTQIKIISFLSAASAHRPSSRNTALV